MNLDNNRMKYFIYIILLLIFFTMPLSFSSTGSYSLHDAKEHINIHDDGTTIITDEITYSISGTVNGVTRTVPFSNQQSITNVSIETPGYYNTLEIEESNNQVTFRVWLYKDEAKTQKVSNENVKLIYHYNFIKGVKIYNDIAEFQYMSWGNGWNQPLDKLITYINLPSSSNYLESWNNPDTYVTSSSIENNEEIVTIYENIPKETSIEQRMLMDKSLFKSSINADVIDKDAKEQIEQDQIVYSNKQSFNNLLFSLPAILSVLLIITPIGMYLKWGRNPKIIYKEDYESQIPTDDSPVFVNAMIPGMVEEVNQDAFSATLLDLIDRKYYKLVTSSEDDTILKRSNKDTSNLKLHEIDIIDFFKRFEMEDNKISLKSIGEDSYTVQQFVHAWKLDALKDVPRYKVNQYFNKTKENLMSGYNILSIFLGVIFIFGLLFFCSGPIVTIGIILSIILIIEQVFIFFFIDTPLGTWTKEGKEFHDKWKNFEKYIKDFSLIKERPPESIQVWGKFLVYATALGCADEVTKNMKKYIEFKNLPENIIYDYDVLSLSYFWGLHHIRTTFIPLGVNNSNFENNGFDTGSFGDIGGPGSGGFGGGGGGVF